MSTILNKTRDRKSFEEKIRTKADNTKRNIGAVIRNFDAFCSIKYNLSIDKIMAEYAKAEENQIYDSLQDWINWNTDRGICASTITMWFSCMKKYLRYNGIRIIGEDVREYLDFPHAIKEEKYPLTKNEIKTILQVSSYKYRLKMLAQISSGLRRGELLQLRKKDLDTTKDRIVANIPAAITKTKKSRVTFFSREIQPALIQKIKELDDDDLVFGSNSAKNESSGDVYQQTLKRYLKKINLDQKYASGVHKITTHSFRAFFITKVSRHDPNLAKYFAGQEQSGDLLVYDRLTLDEKLEKYIEFEPDLLIHDEKKKDEQKKEIVNLRRELEELREYKRQSLKEK